MMTTRKPWSLLSFASRGAAFSGFFLISGDRKMSRIAGIMAASIMVAAVDGRSALADTLVYVVEGRCIEDCRNVGLRFGDGFAGSISVDGAFFAPGAIVGNAALQGYGFLFGDFGLTDSELPDPAFFIAWGSAPEIVDGLFFQGFASNDPASPGPALNLDTLLGGISFASNNGHGFEVPDGSEYSLGRPAYLTVDGIALSTVAPVPLPAAVWLLAASLLGLGAARRRGRRKPG
jgi:hypothetical protein